MTRLVYTDIGKGREQDVKAQMREISESRGRLAVLALRVTCPSADIGFSGEKSGSRSTHQWLKNGKHVKIGKYLPGYVGVVKRRYTAI